MKPLMVAASLGLAVLVTPGSAQAELIFGLTSQSQLVTFDSNTPGTISAPVAISGVIGTLTDIDFRPATGQLYGFSRDNTTGRLYTINTATGVATQSGNSFTISGTAFGIDFNPTVDRLRIVSNNGTSLAVDPSPGTVTTNGSLNYPAGDANAGRTPNVLGVAYTNNFAGAGSTTLYDLDSLSPTGAGGILATQTPGTGALATVGNTSFTPTVAAFDISGATGFAYASNGSTLFRLNLGTGGTVSSALIGSGTQVSIIGLSVQAVPEPGAVAMGLTGLACMGGVVGGFRRRLLAA